MRARMDEYREILHKKASSHLPDWPKGPDDFYVAILSHKKHVRSCEHKDLLWLKLRGKHTVAQVKAAHIKRVGRKVVFYDGRNVVADDTQIRYLNHYRSDVVVFSTKRDDGRAPLAELPAAAVNSRPWNENETSATRSMRDNSAEYKVPDPPCIDVLGELNRGLQSISRVHGDSTFKVEKGPTLYKVLCSDCPHWTNYCPLKATTRRVSDAVRIAEKHLDTDRHKQQVRQKAADIKNIIERVPELQSRYPGSSLEVKIQPFGTGTPWITCASCPLWTHNTFVGEMLSMTVSLLEKHLKSRDHREAIDTEMEDAADVHAEDDPDAMDVDDSPVAFPWHLVKKYDLVKVDGVDALHCKACSAHITDPTTPASVQISDAEDHMDKAKHHCSYMSFLLSETAKTFELPGLVSCPIAGFKELLEKRVKEYPLAKLEFKPVPKQNHVHALQCAVCKGAGFHKYMFKNAVDSFAMASLKKVMQHLTSSQHQQAAEAAVHAPSTSKSSISGPSRPGIAPREATELLESKQHIS
ncbi:hypothetical protein VTL71DRAFT_10217 [Oculimacula yallundae]|uniref:Uncharacterized protein n=1 Tax=Oculimacula yallundae TaxID=86028 RepID=A0ABR4BPL2_9HELO